MGVEAASDYCKVHTCFAMGENSSVCGWWHVSSTLLVLGYRRVG